MGACCQHDSVVSAICPKYSERRSQELSGTPNPWYFLKSIASTNGRRTAVQIGGVLRRFPFSKV